MSKPGNKILNPNFVSEYKYFIKDFLLRLLGLPNCKLTENIAVQDPNTASVVSCGNDIIFSASKWRIFELHCAQGLTEDNTRLANRIVQSFFQISEYNRTGSGKQSTFFSDIQRTAVYNMAIQKGICSWVAGDANSKIEHLFSSLEKWAVKTYEGRSVTLGFVINPNQKAEPQSPPLDWLTFLEDDCSAVITDCIHSLIELDKDCNFLRYLSASEDNHLLPPTLSNRVPLRFSHVIQRYIPQSSDDDTQRNKVGIFLLNNGDIVLVKNGATCFVKRNLQWLNLSYEAFENALQDFTANNNVRSGLLEHVYASVLDVSFSHVGGIISIASDCGILSMLGQDGTAPVLDPCDDLMNGKTSQELLMSSKNDMDKRVLKRSILQSLTSDGDFFTLDRKLRSELIALDGACILNYSGKIRSFGAIIQYESGSSGGGRGAAAKKLSTYGAAVKISTDGYIELYVDGELRYAIK